MHCVANIIRGATLLSRFDPCPLQDTNISPATDVCPHVAEYSAKILITFSHLTAPSAVHLTTCFRPDSQHTQALCTGIIAVISASTVCMLMFYSIYNSSCQVFYKSFEKKSCINKNGAATKSSRTMLKKQINYIILCPQGPHVSFAI